MSPQDSFFESPPLLEWLHDEIFFSLISRHHSLWGQSVARRTAEVLFGHVRGGAHHDLPSYLADFVERTNGVHGQLEKLACGHTVLKYFAAFMPTIEVDNAIACMAGKNVAHLKLRLGILTSRFRANHPLKACEACMAEDVDLKGWAYWHLEHQYPGVWVCLRHGQLLRESMFKSTGVERFQWHLPTSQDLQPWPCGLLNNDDGTNTALTDFSRLVIGIVNGATLDSIDVSRLHELYREELRRRSWLTSGGSLRMPAISKSYLQYAVPLRVLPELSSVPDSAEAAAIQVSRMLRAPRGGTHPLRHLLVIGWLFETPEAFWTKYRSMLGNSVAPSTVLDDNAVYKIDQDGIGTSKREKLIELLSESGASLRSASSAIGIDVSTAMAWAAKAEIQTSRRPKKLKPELRKTIIEKLTLGTDKQDVAELAGLSIGTITRLLLTEVGLHAKWTQARADRARTSARRSWQDALQAHSDAGMKFIRALEPSAYAWLYRNDRAWLDSKKPSPLGAAQTQGMARISWDARDRVLSTKIREAVLAMQCGGGAKNLKLWQIYQVVPELKAKLGALTRLPLTRKAIDYALMRSPSTHTQNLFN